LSTCAAPSVLRRPRQPAIDSLCQRLLRARTRPAERPIAVGQCLVQQERDGKVDEGRRLLRMREMGYRQDRHLGVWDRPGDGAAFVRWRRLVEFADQHQRRCADAAKPVLEACPAYGVAAPDVADGIEPEQGAANAGHDGGVAPAEGFGEEALKDAVRDRGHTPGPHRFYALLEDFGGERGGGVAEHQASHACRMMDRQVHSDAASHRDAGEGEPLQARRVRDCEGVVREHLHRVGSRRRVRCPVAARVHADHVEVFVSRGITGSQKAQSVPSELDSISGGAAGWPSLLQ
jgi:hypothetical protein